jgi:hypothetical protein
VTPLGLLNFLVLQWFGVRLARGTLTVSGVGGNLPGDRVVWTSCGGSQRCRVRDATTLEWWTLLRWVWPLTGWWSDYRWIARRW